MQFFIADNLNLYYRQILIFCCFAWCYRNTSFSVNLCSEYEDVNGDDEESKNEGKSDEERNSEDGWSDSNSDSDEDDN